MTLILDGTMTPTRLRRELEKKTAAIIAAYQEMLVILEREDYLGTLAHFKQIREMREEIISGLVDASREYQDASWREIGEALGLHRSSAQQRFGRDTGQ